MLRRSVSRYLKRLPAAGGVAPSPDHFEIPVDPPLPPGLPQDIASTLDDLYDPVRLNPEARTLHKFATSGIKHLATVIKRLEESNANVIKRLEESNAKVVQVLEESNAELKDSKAELKDSKAELKDSSAKLVQAKEDVIKGLQSTMLRINKELLVAMAVSANRFALEICLRNFRLHNNFQGDPSMTFLCQEFARQELVEEPQKHPVLKDHVKKLLKQLEIAGTVDDKRVAEKIPTVFKHLSEDIHFPQISGTGVFISDRPLDRAALGLFLIRAQELGLFPFTIQYEYEQGKVQIWKGGSFMGTKDLHAPESEESDSAKSPESDADPSKN